MLMVVVLFVCLFCCFTSQVNSYGHGGTVSSPNHTFSLDLQSDSHMLPDTLPAALRGPVLLYCELSSFYECHTCPCKSVLSGHTYIPVDKGSSRQMVA